MPLEAHTTGVHVLREIGTRVSSARVVRHWGEDSTSSKQGVRRNEP